MDKVTTIPLIAKKRNLMNQTLLCQGESLSFIALPEHHNQRLDLFIKSQLPHYSRTFLAKLIDQQAVTINGHPAQKVSHTIKSADQIVITVPQAPEKKSNSEHGLSIPVTVIYQHDHFLIINKPAPLTVHPVTASDTETVTLIDWIKAHHQEIAHVGNLDRPGIIHRLDKETSGLMIIPRTNYAYTVFGELFKERAIQKTYLAIVSGHPEQTGSISYDIGRHHLVRTRMKAYKPGDPYLTAAKHALTHYKVLHYFKDYSLVEVKLITGRTHQIRVHFAAIGHPLIGDFMYGTRSPLIDRHALHATSLHFSFEGVDFKFTQEPPQDFLQIYQNLIPLHL